MIRSTADTCPQLLSLAVHELRTPTNVVGGYLNMLQREGVQSLSERHRGMVDEAEKACARIVALVGELSEISKLDAGLVTLAREELDVFRLVAEVADGIGDASDRGVLLVPAGDRVGARLRGDAPRLRAAFASICRAVVREQPGPCTVVAERRRDTIDARHHAVIVVADESTAHAALRATPGTFDEKRAGLGLALPLARRIIECHDGRIWSPDTTAAGAMHAAVIVSLPIS